MRETVLPIGGGGREHAIARALEAYLPDEEHGGDRRPPLFYVREISEN